MKCCNTCPFAGTDESDQVQNYGCLPEPCDVVKQYEAGKVWMCHSNESRICEGLKEHVGHPFSANGKTIQTYSSWYHGTSGAQSAGDGK